MLGALKKDDQNEVLVLILEREKCVWGGVIYFIIIMTHFFIFIINKDILTTIYSHSFRLPFKGVIGC
jgi:hypothetical protein